MPNLSDAIEIECGQSTYDKPEHEISGWHFFMDPDGFIPSAHNLFIVGKLLAWKKGTDRYYCALIGVPDGVFQYERGVDFPKIKDCIIDQKFLCERGVAGILQEKEKSMRLLIDFVMRHESPA